LALLDVLSKEPPSPGPALAQHPRVIVTPHVAWATLASRRRLMDVTIANIAAFVAGTLQNVVA
jgi:glycerate dehydrogenase